MPSQQNIGTITPMRAQRPVVRLRAHAPTVHTARNRAIDCSPSDDADPNVNAPMLLTSKVTSTEPPSPTHVPVPLRRVRSRPGAPGRGVHKRQSGR
ncbi:MAG TPA: hypothetical protein VGP26_29635 [Actinophytocola sp.]|jgi:hypothetical protein|nr:hypothetical protein [Actinophytocola sp.]